MKSFWTILASLLLAFMPAAAQQPVQAGESACAACHCCVREQSRPVQNQNTPALPDAGRVSPEHFLQEADSTIFAAPVSPAGSVCVAANSPIAFVSSVPVFERLCTLLI